MKIVAAADKEQPTRLGQIARKLFKKKTWLKTKPNDSSVDVNTLYSLKKNDPIFLIYQMGKVGSTSIYKAITRLHQPAPVFHIHYLEKSRLQQSIAWHTTNNYPQLPEHLLKSKAIGHYLLNNRQKVQWKIISLVRDPIALQASIIFQNVEEAFSTIIDKEKNKIDNRKASKLVEDLLSDYTTRQTHFVNWFDNEIKKVFSIDIFDYPFDKEKGFSIINKKNVDILLIKFEKLQDCYTEAFDKFTGIKDVRLPITNISSEKKYGYDYKELIDSLKLPSSLCEGLYSTKIVRHFYKPSEINAFIQRWSPP